MFKLTEKDITSNWKHDSSIMVSICCITYNQEKYIENAINSFLEQKTSFKFEIIIGNDCSTDNTKSILNNYQNKYPGIIRIIHSKKNIGANANLLQLFQLAKGKYIALCEGDDYWCDRNKLEIQYSMMSNRNDISFSFHSAYINNTDQIKYRKNKEIFLVEDILNNIYDQFAPTASYMFLREIINVLPEWFYKAPIGDYYLEIYSTKLGKCLYIDKPMSVYQQMTINSWSEKNRKSLNNFIYTREKMIEYDKLTISDFRTLNDRIENRITRNYFLLVRECIIRKNYTKFYYYLNILKFRKIPIDIIKKYKLITILKKFPAVIKLIFKIKSKISKR
ncbi:glycosyltransferase [Proteus sp. G2667]|uniref:glycosyltransferase n=1 Tax=Proteus sp. G2667 TaxID=2698880 RepID=UPI0013780F51|nr:glycosyltransferase [Proteus sp. G2667]NBM57126.1 glycosyltransferase [Proteus sp. G2667]